MASALLQWGASPYLPNEDGEVCDLSFSPNLSLSLLSYDCYCRYLCHCFSRAPQTPLHLATQSSDTHSAALLIHSGAPLNAQDKVPPSPSSPCLALTEIPGRAYAAPRGS